MLSAFSPFVVRSEWVWVFDLLLVCQQQGKAWAEREKEIGFVRAYSVCLESFLAKTSKYRLYLDALINNNI